MYKLDSDQLNVVLDKSKYLMVIAGAGSGKSLTILAKIKYLIKSGISPNEIIVVSFTNFSSNSLKEKIKNELNINMNVYTFHKLALSILNNKYNIVEPNTLEYIIDDFFYNDLLDNKNIYKFFKVKNEIEYIELLESKEFINYKKTISTFIHLFKCNNYKLDDFNNFLKKSKHIFNFNFKKEKMFLLFSLNIYLKYTNYLEDNNLIDFDDMIIKATDNIDSYNKKIKYIIIDEYQDTSFIRFNLIKKLLDKTNSNLMVVGDDYQSIYKFSGCNINLFLNFKNYFDNSKIMYLNTTYRNSFELIKIASNFIQKNKNQIKKNLKSNKHLNNPIKIIYYQDQINDFKKLLNKIYDNKELLVLGRNNFDIDRYIDREFKLINDYYFYKNIKFKYMTIHKSKGLESDNVIILNLSNDILGIPSQIKNDKILRFVESYERYPFSEERRLFYVALTRTKNKVYLFTPKDNESIFVKEIKKEIN